MLLETLRAFDKSNGLSRLTHACTPHFFRKHFQVRIFCPRSARIFYHQPMPHDAPPFVNVAIKREQRLLAGYAEREQRKRS